MLVVEFTDNTTLEANSYEESDRGIKLYGKNETFLAFAPMRSIQYLYESSASQTPPTAGSHEKKGDGSGTPSSTFVVEFTHGTQLGVESYEESDRGLKLYGKNETLLAYAPLSSIRYMQRTGATATPDEKEKKPTGFVVELTDGTTLEAKNYGLSDQGVKFFDKNENLSAYVPHRNLRYMRRTDTTATPDEKEKQSTGIVVELTDGTTFRSHTYSQSEKGVKFYDESDTLSAYASNRSVRYVYEPGSAPTGGDGSGSGSGGATE